METIFLEHDDRRFWDLGGNGLAGDRRGVEADFGNDCVERVEGSIVSVVSRSEKVMRVAREAHGLSGSFAPPRVVRF
jgi:hypothetical protein